MSTTTEAQSSLVGRDVYLHPIMETIDKVRVVEHTHDEGEGITYHDQTGGIRYASELSYKLTLAEAIAEYEECIEAMKWKLKEYRKQLDSPQ